MKTRKILNEGYKMLMTRRLMFFLVFGLFVFACVGEVSAAVDKGKIRDTIYRPVNAVLCGNIFKLIIGIATAIASLVSVLAGIKWVASENDPGARKQAKDVFVHAIVGLVLILVAMGVLSTAFTSLGSPCPP